MIKLLRVDERLLHGMVAVSWTSRVQPEVIVIANDKAVEDSFFSMTLKMAKPAGVELRIYTVDDAIEKLTKTSLARKGVLLVAGNMVDTEKLILGLEQGNPVKEVNVSIAGVERREGLKQVAPQLYLNKDDFESIARIHDKNINIYLQAVPTSRLSDFNEISKQFS